VQAFENPLQAVQTFSRNHVDLVISDVQMPGMDGFDVAQKVAEGLGTTPPMVLLISGFSDVEKRVEEFPPSVIIGLLPKPFGVLELSEVVSLLERSRQQCPGRLGPFCRHVQHDGGGDGDGGHAKPLCGCSQYSGCQHYDTLCGISLRQWVSSGGRAVVR